MTIIPANQQTGALPNAAQLGKQVKIAGDENQVQKDMFLKLMIAQLRNQDPTAPMDQKDMMASMTQFSQVEQMQNITRAMETLSLAQGVNMVGQHVQYRHVEVNDLGIPVRDEVRTGRVVSVEQKDGQVKLTLENGVSKSPSDISSVSLEQRPIQTLVGKYVTFSHVVKNAAGEEKTVTLTGLVKGIDTSGTQPRLAINGRAIDPAKVDIVSNLPLTGGSYKYSESPEAGWS